VSFLIADFERVLGVLTLSLVAGMVANLLYVVFDPRWFRALGDAVTTAIGLLVAVRLYQVFPFDFSGWSVDWSWLIRLLLVVGVVASVVGVLAKVVEATRALAPGPSDRQP
jgi:hypothetical protein